MTTVFLVDDHEIVRRGLADLVRSQSDLQVVGEASTVRQAVGRIEATLPDVAVLDVRLPDGNGIDLCRDIRSRTPTVACLILTAYDDDSAVSASVLAGAAGYVLKDVGGSRLVDAIRSVARGRSLMSDSLVRRATEQLRQRAGEDGDPRLGSLGLRERQILRLIADGLTNRQIGDELGIAEKTVKNYVSSLLSKLGLERRTQAAVFELEHRSDRPRRPGS
ncbi:response regulator transcription factor [Microbacterium trichothecenolyticum]|uniref:Response regulator transcription factor n=1 Tax=Microbacterium ureisolvens TaxID=2781186 RepID=A0ABS7I307_9MICO|nr:MULTISPECIES: response regulator transcription factor [Microbacterium]MBW9111938.1 response regulator transcription factor [Microbacterium ureisolvens]MBW9120812.1 response regulator transcription factor [Microbacterium trichothecenolyticum]